MKEGLLNRQANKLSYYDINRNQIPKRYTSVGGRSYPWCQIERM